MAIYHICRQRTQTPEACTQLCTYIGFIEGGYLVPYGNHILYKFYIGVGEVCLYVMCQKISGEKVGRERTEHKRIWVFIGYFLCQISCQYVISIFRYSFSTNFPTFYHFTPFLSKNLQKSTTC